MKRRGAILTGVLAAALLASGGVVASALLDTPQDARPVQDPTAALNRQTPAQVAAPAQGPAPVETAPAGDPAPIAPVAITPPAPVAITPLVDEPDEEEAAEVEEEVAAAPKPAGPPGVRQRRRVAIVQAIDKVTAETMRFEVEVGGRPVRFARTLIFTAKACEVSAPDERTEDAVAYLEVSLQPRGVVRGDEPRQIFRGWMFASAPAVNGLQHPVYDAWVVGCKA
jgi:hypothetical protein